MAKSYDDILAVMTSEYTAQSGCVPDEASDIGIRLRVLASQIFELTSRLENLKKQLFPTTATGEALDLHAGMKGLERKKAGGSSGVLRFCRTTPAAAEIIIPEKTLCRTASGEVTFETAEQCVIPAGGTFAEAQAKSIEGGIASNAAAGRITVFATPPQGVAAVTNPAPFTGGTDAETDDELRSRLTALYSAVSNGTNPAFYYDTAMSFDFVYSAAVLPKARGAGSVDVVIAGKGGALSAEQIAKVQADLNGKRELCVDVLVKSPRLVPCNISVQVKPRDEYVFESLADEIKALITAFLNRRQVGEPLLLTDLYACLYEFGGIENYRIALPAADIEAGADGLITAGSITVSRMEVQ